MTLLYFIFKYWYAKLLCGHSLIMGKNIQVSELFLPDLVQSPLAVF